MAVLVELIRARSRQQRYLGALGNFARDQCKRAGESAVNRGGLIARDQPVGLGAGHGWIALDIRYDQIELGAAQGFNAASIIDHLHRQFRRVDAALADLRKTAGNWIKTT